MVLPIIQGLIREQFQSLRMRGDVVLRLGKTARHEGDILEAMMKNNDLLAFASQGTVNVSSLRVLFDDLGPVKKDECDVGSSLSVTLSEGLQQLASQVAYIEGLSETDREGLLVALDNQLLASIDPILRTLGFCTGRTGLQTVWLPVCRKEPTGTMVKKYYVPISPSANPGGIWFEDMRDCVEFSPPSQDESLPDSSFQLRKAVLELFLRATSLLGMVHSEVNWEALLSDSKPQELVGFMRRVEAQSFQLINTEPPRFLHNEKAQLINGEFN
jgi:hypothetical protein